jgi:plastocyanin
MRFVAALVLSALLAATIPASAEEPVVARTLAYLYIPPRVTMPAGAALVHQNLDRDLHNLVAVDAGPDGAPLFASAPTTFLSTNPVTGAQNLEPGVYGFVCSLHPAIPTMRGELEVTAA